MRTLILLALGASLAVPAAAQGTELIIRRPGEKDQIIRMDSLHQREAMAQLTQLQSQMRSLTGDMQRRLAEATAGRPTTWTFGMNADTLSRRLIEAQGQMVEALRNGNALQRRAFDDTALAFRNRIMLPSNAEMNSRARMEMAQTARSMLQSPPRLGVTYNPSASETDKWGVAVNGITPGGPADRAGMRVGDIITRIDGKSLTSTEGRKPLEDESLPAVRLMEYASKFQPGKPVAVDFRRGTESRSVKITPTVDEDQVVTLSAPRIITNNFGAARAGSVTGRPLDLMYPSTQLPLRSTQEFSFPAEGGNASFSYYVMNGSLGNLELAPLNEKLGAYFGTTEGVLVINTGSELASTERMAIAQRGRGQDSMKMLRPSQPAPQTFGLQPGDVVTAVDGRKVTSPGQLIRALTSYERGDEVKVTVMRQKKQETLTTKLP